MQTKKLFLKTIDDIKIMQDIIKPFTIDIDILAGSYVVDARSFMGVMGLGLNKELKIALHTDNKELANDIWNNLQQEGIHCA